MRQYLSNPYVQLGLTILILVGGFGIEPGVDALRRQVDTKLVGEWCFSLLLLTGPSYLIIQALRTGATQMRFGLRVTRDGEPPLFWLTIATFGIGVIGGVVLLARLLMFGP